MKKSKRGAEVQMNQTSKFNPEGPIRLSSTPFGDQLKNYIRTSVV